MDFEALASQNHRPRLRQPPPQPDFLNVKRGPGLPQAPLENAPVGRASPHLSLPNYRFCVSLASGYSVYCVTEFWLAPNPRETLPRSLVPEGYTRKCEWKPSELSVMVSTLSDGGPALLFAGAPVWAVARQAGEPDETTGGRGETTLSGECLRGAACQLGPDDLDGRAVPQEKRRQCFSGDPCMQRASCYLMFKPGRS